MNTICNTRRDFLSAAGLTILSFASHAFAASSEYQNPKDIDENFFVRPEELTLEFRNRGSLRQLSFTNFKGSPKDWKKACYEKLVELSGFSRPSPCQAKLLRSIEYQTVKIEAWIMDVDGSLSIPAYLLTPKSITNPNKAVMAIHGHGQAEFLIKMPGDYHHAFGLELAKAGHIVLCPALRGFGALGDMAAGDKGRCLNYWASSRGYQFSLVTDNFLYGKTVIGQTIEDLLRWEEWLSRKNGIKTFDVAGISYGGDLAQTYPAFSKRIRKIYASGTLGSFSAIFSRCYNAPAHCIPDILNWMDRSDIAGLCAPVPIRLHYGELDTPGPSNNSASYNETVAPAMTELKAIYKAFQAEDKVTMYVTPGSWHEMDNKDLLAFLSD